MPEEKKLSPRQIDFMRVLHAAFLEENKPVSVSQIRIRLQRSDSRVRTHVKILLASGYLRCVGKSRVKRYVPSILWMESFSFDDFKKVDHSCIGGYCETIGCRNLAEDFYKSRYLCRRCIVGVDDKEDLRRQMLEGACNKSSAGLLVDEGSETYIDRAYSKRNKSRKTSRRNAACKTKIHHAKNSVA